MDIQYCRMDALTLSTFLSPILTVTTVWNTGETGDINNSDLDALNPPIKGTL